MLAGKRTEAVGQQGAECGLLGVAVAVEGAQGQAGRVGDLFHSGGLEPLPLEERGGTVRDLPPGGVPTPLAQGQQPFLLTGGAHESPFRIRYHCLA